MISWRLNQELFPEPGRPIARTTTPLDGCCGVAVGVAAAGAVVSLVSEAGADGDGVPSAGAPCVEGEAVWRVRPRPPLPRRRRRLGRALSLSPGRTSGVAGVAFFCFL